jgi:hypothetical protein
MGGYNDNVSHGNNVGGVDRRCLFHDRNEWRVTVDVMSVLLLQM